MSTAKTLVQECESKGIVLYLDAGKLKFKAPTGTLNDDLKGRLRTHKAEVIEILSPGVYDAMLQGAIDDLNTRGVRIMDYPEATRAWASKLEIQMTESFNSKDWGSFFGYLQSWRRCFH
jgi:hypothetical protein